MGSEGVPAWVKACEGVGLESCPLDLLEWTDPADLSKWLALFATEGSSIMEDISPHPLFHSYFQDCSLLLLRFDLCLI